MTYGIDIGIRSFALFGVGHRPWTKEEVIVSHFYELDKMDRWKEINHLSTFLYGMLRKDDILYIEEPPLAGSLNIRTALKLNQTAGALMATHSGQSYLVPVSSWKKAVVGSGSAAKEMVASWLAEHHPDWHASCDGNQNIMDAACLFIYGQQNLHNARRIAEAEIS